MLLWSVGMPINALQLSASSEFLKGYTVQSRSIAINLQTGKSPSKNRAVILSYPIKMYKMQTKQLVNRKDLSVLF